MDPEVLLQQLGELGRQLDQATEDMAELDVVATGAAVHYAELKEEYEDTVAREFLDCEGSIEAKKMQARLNARAVRKIAEQAHLEAEMAKSSLRNQRDAVKALQSRIDVGRSLISHQKTMMGLT